MSKRLALLAITACVVAGMSGCETWRENRAERRARRAERMDRDRVVYRDSTYDSRVIDWRDEGVRWTDSWYDDSLPEPTGRPRYYRTTRR